MRTARGRVLENADLLTPYYLQFWPNFPRLPHTSCGMRIPKERARVPKAHVYSFYNTAVTTGLAGSAKRRADGLIALKEVMKNKPTKRGLLASILRGN